MRIVHFSDWHWRFRDLPEADLYVCTGDMYDNYPVINRDRRGPMGRYSIHPAREIELQLADARVFVGSGGFRQRLGSPNAPIVCVRGNHDFTDLAPLFEGCNLVHEFIDNEVVEVLGLRITGHRGIPRIFGTWSDEVTRSLLMERVRCMESCDLFLTHYPPSGMIDYEIIRGRIESYGLEGMLEELEARMGVRGIHCFGHIHGCGGVVKEMGPGSIIGGTGPLRIYSNAACHTNVIEV